MKAVWSWLADYVDLSGVTPEELAERWTLAGLEVDAVERIGEAWDPELIRVGALRRVEPHPDADRLVLAWVDWGAGEPHRVVTGAPNLFPYLGKGELDPAPRIVLAREGAELVDPYADEPRTMVLKGRKVRGILSDAMVCSEKELGMSEEHEGILFLDPDAPIGMPLREHLGDAVIELDLTANYAYAANMLGLARETAALLDRPFAPPTPALPGAAAAERAGFGIEIADPDLCPRYIGRLIRNVEIGPSPFWARRRLRLAGMRPINNVVDVSNYAMLEWGEPLHAFDYDRLRARAEAAGRAEPTITVRRATPGERMTTLDGEERVLDEQMLLICDDAGPVAIAGVMGGAETEVGEDTRSVLLEAASFDFISVRRTSGALKLHSESAWRFGRDVPPALAEIGSARASALLADWAGGAPDPGVVDAHPRPRERRELRVPLAEFPRILGAPIPEDDILAILGRLDFQAAIEDDELRVTPSALRVDQAIPADIIEEVARVWGYDRLPATTMADELPAQRDNPTLMLEEAARDSLVGAGLQEIVPYRLISPEHEAGVAAEPERAPAPEGYVRLANPVSPERAAMRRSILTGLLDAAAANLRFAERVALFELGPVYHALPEGLPDEPARVGLLLCGPRRPEGWRDEPGRDLDFYDAKGAVERLLQALGVEASWRAAEGEQVHPAMHPGRCARVISAEGADLGAVGELHPLVRGRWSLGERPVAVADLDLAALGAAGGHVRRFRAVSSYPAVGRDLAVIVPADTPAAAVERVIREAGGPLLVGCEVFDVYRGKPLKEDQKSLAFRLRYQAPDKTLSGKAVDGMRGRVVKALEREIGAEVRA